MSLSDLIEEVYTSTEEEIRERNGKIITSRISSGELKLVDLVEALGSKLTSPEVETRVVGMGILSHVFEYLKPDFLSEKELKFIVDFLHDRLKDQHLVIPKVILCIQPIVRCKNLPAGSAPRLLRQLFQEANIQSHTHKHRRAFYLTIQYLLRHKLEDMKTLSSEFIMNFLQSMDGEKDPRNLIILFSSIPIILSNFPLGPFVEDFFEVLSCYFPVDFSPTVGVPGGDTITRDDLANALHLCLSHTNKFVDFLFPLVMEKLNSSVVEAKLDSLRVLELCCERSYTARDLGPHFSEIWHAMRREIFMGGNEEVELACIRFLKTAFKLISTNELILKSSVAAVFAECKHHLSEPELRLSQPTSRILVGIAESSPESCSAILPLTVPLLYEQFTVKSSSSERKGILSIMTMIIGSLRHFPSLRLDELVGNWDEILAMWFTLLSQTDEDFVVLALSFFTRMLRPRLESSELESVDKASDLDEKSRNLLQAHLLSLLTKDEVSSEVTSCIISTLDELSKHFGPEFVSVSAPQLLALCEKPEERQDVYLSCLAECSAYMEVGGTVIPRLMSLLISAKEEGRNYEALLHCLSAIVQKACRDDSELPNFVTLHLQDFIRVCLDARLKKLLTAYQLSATIIRNLLRAADERKQQELVNRFWNARVEAIDLNGLVEVNVTPGLLGEALLGSLRPSISIAKKEELMRLILEEVTAKDVLESGAEAGTCPRALDTLANIRLYAVLLNKSNGNEFTKLLEGLEVLLKEKLSPAQSLNDAGDADTLMEEVEAEPNTSLLVHSEEAGSERQLITFFVWIVKALAMRGFSDLGSWVDKMIKLLESPKFGAAAAEGFATLMSDCPYSLNADSFANFRFLYTQRIFQISVPKLVAAYKSCSLEEVKVNYIRSLTAQLKHVPHVVLEMELGNVLPLLVASLSFSSGSEAPLSTSSANTPVLISTLSALKELLVNNPNPAAFRPEARSPIHDYFMDLTPRLLRLTLFGDSMQVRILSLQCLRHSAKFPIHVIQPLKEIVIRGLADALDDPKRFVRKEAVLTRNVWILIGSPGGI